MKFRGLLMVLAVLVLSFFLGLKEAEAMQNVTIESYRTQAVSIAENGKEEKVIFKKATLEIYYYDLNGNKCLLDLVKTDDSGSVKNLVLSLPDEIHRDQLFFRYLLKNEKYGHLVDTKGIQYGAITSAFIPRNKTIKLDTTREFPNAKKISNAAKAWELFVTSIDKILTSIDYAEQVTNYRMREDFSFKPIFIQYESDYSLPNSFNISKKNTGLIHSGDPYISINDADDNTKLINLVHEWSHWAMYCALDGFNTGGGYYDGHYSICDPRVSWKEGWAIAQSNLISTAYWNWKYSSYQFGRTVFDTSPQEHQVAGMSTISTVNGVLIDIFDKDYTYNGLEGVNEEEYYDLASDHSRLTTPFNTDRAIKDGQLANGLLTIAMINSKATTLSEYIQYLKSNGMIKSIERFDVMLNINGLDINGNYTVNGVK